MPNTDFSSRMGALPVIRIEEAQKLVASGDWLYDIDVRAKLSDVADKIKLPTESTYDVWSAEGIEHNSSCIAGLLSALEDQFEAKSVIEDNFGQWSKIELRLKPNVVFKIQRSALDTLEGIFKITLFFAAAGPLGPAVICGATVPVVELLKKLVANYITLEDPVEKEVLENVWKLSSRLRVVDHDALKHGEYAKAYAPNYPTDEEVVDSLSNIDGADIRRAVSDLAHKGVIVRINGGKLRIVF